MKIGGFVPFSTIDFPGRLSCVLFLQGCEWRCSYCHNKHLWKKELGIEYKEEFFKFLQSRRGLLDAVVFSGGEPLLQEEIVIWAKEIDTLGFQVGLHTGGAKPETLKKMLPFLSWIGLDYKAHTSNYIDITKEKHSGENFLESFRMIKESGIEFEIRSTIDPSLFTEQDLHQMAYELKHLKVNNWVIQRARDESRHTKKAIALQQNTESMLKLRDIIGSLEIRN